MRRHPRPISRLVWKTYRTLRQQGGSLSLSLPLHLHLPQPLRPRLNLNPKRPLSPRRSRKVGLITTADAGVLRHHCAIAPGRRLDVPRENVAEEQPGTAIAVCADRASSFKMLTQRL
jgi:hypothetical protein